MYICICNSVTEADIHRAVDEGASCMKHLKKELNCSSKCGSCHSRAKACLNEALENQAELVDISFA